MGSNDVGPFVSLRSGAIVDDKDVREALARAGDPHREPRYDGEQELLSSRLEFHRCLGKGFAISMPSAGFSRGGDRTAAQRLPARPAARPAVRPATAWDAMSSGLSADSKFKVRAYDDMQDISDQLEARQLKHGETVRSLAERCVMVSDLEKRNKELEAAVALRDQQIDAFKRDLKEGKPVTMAPAEHHAVKNVLANTLSSIQSEKEVAKKEKQVGLVEFAPDEEADLEAMPGWSLEGWLGSLNLQDIVSSCVAGHIRSGGKVNSAVELRFMQQLGRLGNRDTLMAMLRSTNLVSDLAEAMWIAIEALVADFEFDEQRKREREAEVEAESVKKAAQAEKKAALADIEQIKEAIKSERSASSARGYVMQEEMNALQHELQEAEQRVEEMAAVDDPPVEQSEGEKSEDSKPEEPQGARKLSYAPTSVFFAGLSAVVGRCHVEPSDNERLLREMCKEHVGAVDCDVIFEPPNYLINTTSKIEWWAAADPDEGLRELGITEYPKEQRPGSPNRILHHPDHFREGWDEMNDKLLDVSEGPLSLPAFVALRLYTGPMVGVATEPTMIRPPCSYLALRAVYRNPCAVHQVQHGAQRRQRARQQCDAIL